MAINTLSVQYAKSIMLGKAFHYPQDDSRSLEFWTRAIIITAEDGQQTNVTIFAHSAEALMLPAELEAQAAATVAELPNLVEIGDPVG